MARSRADDHAAGHPAARAVPHGLLFLRSARPRERRLRCPADEQGPRPDAGDVRVRGKALLHLVFLRRGPEQSCPAESRRAALDRAHHDHMGHGDGLHGLRGGTLFTLPDAVYPRRCGGRLFPRRDPVSDLLASIGVSRADPRHLHGLDSARHVPRLAPVGFPARARRRAWAQGLAVAVRA